MNELDFQKFTLPSSPIFSDLAIIESHDFLLDLKLLTFVHNSVNIYIIPTLLLQFFFTILPNAHQHDMRQVCEVIFMTQPNTSQHGLNQPEMLVQNLGITFHSMSNNPLQWQVSIINYSCFCSLPNISPKSLTRTFCLAKIL